MKEYLLLLPIIFIFHDMEEIVGFGWFFRRYPGLFKCHPKLTAAYRGFTDAGFAVAVYEEFIPFFGLTLLAYYFPSKVLFAIWYGMLLSLTGHFVLHILVCLYLKKLVPSLITSLICLPIGILIMIKTTCYLTFDGLTSTVVVLTIPAMAANGKLAHRIMHLFNRKTTDNRPESICDRRKAQSHSSWQ